MTPHRVIVPVTFADDSFEAVAVAAAFAVALGAELSLAGIAPLAPIEPLLDTPDVGRLARQVEQQELVDRILAERLAVSPPPDVVYGLHHRAAPCIHGSAAPVIPPVLWRAPSARRCAR